MNDIRRTILWVIFGFSMVLLWDKWQLHNGNKATFFPSSNHAVTETATGPAGAATAATGAASVPSPTTALAAQGAAAVPGQPAPAAPAARERVEVTTDVYRLTFDSEGGSLTHAELLKHVALTKLN